MRGTPKSSILGNHISDHGGLDDDKLKWIVECYGGVQHIKTGNWIRASGYHGLWPTILDPLPHYDRHTPKKLAISKDEIEHSDLYFDCKFQAR